MKNHTVVMQRYYPPKLLLSVARPTAIFVYVIPAPLTGGFPKDPHCVGVAEARHFDGTETGGGMALWVSRFGGVARSGVRFCSPLASGHPLLHPCVKGGGGESNDWK